MTLVAALVGAFGSVGDMKHVSGVKVGSLSGQQEPERGWFLCNGVAVSRTTYAKLFNIVTFLQSGTTASGTNAITGLSDTSLMAIGMKVEGTGIPSGTTVASITSSTAITISANATASGTVTLRFFSLAGNGDGSTTFNLPSHLDSFAMARGANGHGSRFGALGHTHLLNSHSHTLGGHGHTLGGHGHTMGGHGHSGQTNGSAASAGAQSQPDELSAGAGHVHFYSTGGPSNNSTGGPSTNSSGAPSPDATSGLAGTPTTAAADPAYQVASGMLIRYA